MMRLLVSVAMVAVVGWVPDLAIADSATKNANDLSELAADLLVEEARMKLVQKQLDVAKARRGIADELKNAAASDVETEQSKRLLGVPSIVVDDAWVEVAREPAKFCKADNFLRYQCLRKMECEFLADERLCALPAGKTEPMVLKVTYACGTDIRRIVVPISQQAYLTCK